MDETRPSQPDVGRYTRPEGWMKLAAQASMKKKTILNEWDGFCPGLRKKSSERRARPLSTRRAMHVVLRSDKAKGSHSLRKHAPRVDRILRRLSKKFNVRVTSMANVGNHIHIALRISNEDTWRQFISGFAGGIAKAVGYSRAAGDGQPFWNSRPFTRVVAWGEAFEILKDYITLNTLEALGLVPLRQKGQRMTKAMRRLIRKLKKEYRL